MTGAVAVVATVQFSVTELPATAMTSFGSKRKPTELKSGTSEDSKEKAQGFIMMIDEKKLGFQNVPAYLQTVHLLCVQHSKCCFNSMTSD